MSSEPFFILVEGSPDSPELSFLNNVIANIFSRNHTDYVAQPVEVGSSSIFSNPNFAQYFYKQSSAHKRHPVLAIADSDFRVAADKKMPPDNELLTQQKTKTLFWQRHEWENYLLDETTLIADLANQFASRTVISNQDLDNFVSDYFKSSIKNEFFECLKFNLNSRIDKHSSINKPDDFDIKNTKDIEEWFFKEAKNRAISVRPLRDNVFQEIMATFRWTEYLDNTQNLDIEFAKQHFRGKECFEKLISFMNREHSLHLEHKKFTRNLLRKMQNQPTKLADDLEILLQQALQ